MLKHNKSLNIGFRATRHNNIPQVIIYELLLRGHNYIMLRFKGRDNNHWHQCDNASLVHSQTPSLGLQLNCNKGEIAANSKSKNKSYWTRNVIRMHYSSLL